MKQIKNKYGFYTIWIDLSSIELNLGSKKYRWERLYKSACTSQIELSYETDQV